MMVVNHTQYHDAGPAAFRITTPATATQDFVGGWEAAIAFVVVSENTVFDSVTIQQWNYVGSTWNDLAGGLTFTSPSWTGAKAAVGAYGNPLRFRAKGVVTSPASTEYTDEVVITYTTPVLTITKPTSAFTWTRGDNDFFVHVANAAPLGVDIYDMVSGWKGTLTIVQAGGIYVGTLSITDSGTRTFRAELIEGSFAGSPIESATVTGTVS